MFHEILKINKNCSHLYSLYNMAYTLFIDLQQISQDSNAEDVEPPVSDTGPSTSQQPATAQSEYQQ